MSGTAAEKDVHANADTDYVDGDRTEGGAGGVGGEGEGDGEGD